MKNFKYYNNIINEVVVYVDSLIGEQSPDDLRDKYSEISDKNISLVLKSYHNRCQYTMIRSMPHGFKLTSSPI